jgi:uncharacterized protein YecE (DUF72 family)
MTAVAIPQSSCSWKERASVVQYHMTTTDLKNLLERVQTWPEEAQDELVAVANQIESELQGRDYLATHEELRIIDAAIRGARSPISNKLRFIISPMPVPR